MILAPHMLVGSALALKIGNPLLGIPVAIISHYFLDATPHAEYPIHNLKFLRTKNFSEACSVLIKISCDIGSAVFLILLAAHYAHQSLLFAIAGGFAGILPDSTHVLFMLFPGNELLAKHYAFHHKVHFPKEKYASPYLKFGLQVAAVVFSLAAIGTLR